MESSSMKQNVTVVILAAGLGTRMKSKRAKVLHRAGGLRERFGEYHPAT